MITLRILSNRSVWWNCPAWAPWHPVLGTAGTRSVLYFGYLYWIIKFTTKKYGRTFSYFFWKPTMFLTFGAEGPNFQTFLDHQDFISTPDMFTFLRSRWTDAHIDMRHFGQSSNRFRAGGRDVQGVVKNDWTTLYYRYLSTRVRVLVLTTGKCQDSTSQRDPDPRLGITDAPEWLN